LHAATAIPNNEIWQYEREHVKALEASMVCQPSSSRCRLGPNAARLPMPCNGSTVRFHRHNPIFDDHLLKFE